MRVCVLATGEQITVRARDLWHVMPGHVVLLTFERRWQHRNQLYAVGEVSEAHIDVPALGLPPLRVEERGALNVSGAPAHAAGQGAAGEPEELQQLRAQIRATERTAYEMEQMLPGAVAGSGADPVLNAIARRKSGDVNGAVQLLMDLVAEDLRCLDAHAYLGNFVFPTYPEHALIHYDIGVAIGDHALGPGFAGALPWSYLNNRPFLRCLHGKGLALWRLRRLEEGAGAFECPETRRRMTLEEWSLTDDEEPGELVGGYLVPEETVTFLHAAAVTWLVSTLGEWADKRRAIVLASGLKVGIRQLNKGRNADLSMYLPGSRRPSRNCMLARGGALRAAELAAVERERADTHEGLVPVAGRARRPPRERRPGAAGSIRTARMPAVIGVSPGCGRRRSQPEGVALSTA